MKRLLSICLLFAVQAQAAQNPLWDLTLMNTNSCARESQKSAKSFYLYADGLTVGRAVAKLAKSENADVSKAVTTGWSELHRSLYFASSTTLNALLSKQLPLISSASEINPILLQRVVHAPLSSPVQPKCLQIKKNFPAVVDANRVRSKELNELAKAYLDSEKYVADCANVELEDAAQPEFVLRWDLTDSNDETSFEFWQSYKIYLSALWKLGAFKSKSPVYGDWITSFPIEEMTLLIPEGCSSLSRPECRSDFLSQSQITQLLSADDFRATSMLARDFGRQQLMTPIEGSSEMTGVTPIAEPAKLMNDLARLRQQSANLLFQSQAHLTAIFHQKSAADLVHDIEASLATETHAAWASLESACVENQVFTDDQMSALAKELKQSVRIIAVLDRNEFPGATAQANFQNAVNLARLLKPVCDRNRDRLSVGNGGAGSKPWLSDYFGSLLPPDLVNKMLKPLLSEDAIYLKLENETLCTSAIACWREVLESATRLYQVALSSSSTMMNGATLDSDLNHNLAGPVACKIYDPWAETHRRVKKLLIDTASAIATGVLQVPLYLDLTPSVPKVASFKQLVDSNAIRLDPIFMHESWKKTMFLDVGRLAQAPCTISISDGGNGASRDNNYLFKGITASTCSSHTDVTSTQDALAVTQAKTSRESVCGSCSINFETVSVVAARAGFGVVGAGLRMVGALAQFFRSNSNPYQKPKSVTIRPEFLVAAYQRYGGIPDKCVRALTHEGECLKNVCVAKTVTDFKLKYSVKVERAQLINSRDLGQGADRFARVVKIKLAGNAGRVAIPIVCDGQSDPLIKWDQIDLTNAVGLKR